MNTSFNGNEKAFPYRRFVFDVYNRGIHTGGATSFPLSKAVVSSCNRWRFELSSSQLSWIHIAWSCIFCSLQSFNEYLQVIKILHLSFVHLGSRYWDYYWWILNHPAAVIRSNTCIMKVELLAFLLLSFGGSTTFSSFIPIVPQDFFGRKVFIIPF